MKALFFTSILFLLLQVSHAQIAVKKPTAVKISPYYACSPSEFQQIAARIKQEGTVQPNASYLFKNGNLSCIFDQKRKVISVTNPQMSNIKVDSLGTILEASYRQYKIWYRYSFSFDKNGHGRALVFSEEAGTRSPMTSTGEWTVGIALSDFKTAVKPLKE